MQRLVGFQVDFSSVITKLMRHLKGRSYYVSGKNNLFDSVEVSDYKRLFNLIDGQQKCSNYLKPSKA